MYIKALALCGLASTLMLAGCASSSSGYHHSHEHKHGYISHDYGYKTYKRPHTRVYHQHMHHKRVYNHHGQVPQYPYTYGGNKYGAHTRMSTSDEYGQGYAAGCRTAHTGMMYKNPKLLSDSQHYQMGWETGFNHCHFDRTHIKGEKDKYSYIPY